MPGLKQLSVKFLGPSRRVSADHVPGGQSGPPEGEQEVVSLLEGGHHPAGVNAGGEIISHRQGLDLLEMETRQKLDAGIPLPCPLGIEEKSPGTGPLVTNDRAGPVLEAGAIGEEP